MRSPGTRKKHRQMNEINVVPYIDVMLVLLVIFMVTAPLLTEGVQVELPQATANPIESAESVPFVVHVDVDGNYFLNQNSDEAVTLHEVQLKAKAVKTVKPQTAFMVRGDASVDFDSVVQAMVALQAAGVDDVGIVTRSPPASSSPQ